jgi:phosphatidylglycerol lysyltransferase
MISAGAVRLRMYLATGLSAAEVAAVIVLCGLTFGIGVTFVLALALLLEPAEAAVLLRVSTTFVWGVGVVVLAALAGYLVWGAMRRASILLGAWQLTIPGPTTTLSQIVLAGADLACAGAVLYWLLPPEWHMPYPLFLSAYLLALVAGILSHVPAGLGVFETVLLLALPEIPRDTLIASVLTYRIFYYLLPLLLAVGILAVHELFVYRKHVVRGLELTQNALGGAAPQVMAVIVLAAGTVLLFSGARPVPGERLAFLSAYLPLPLLELSHLAGSLVGLTLLLLGHALYRRVSVAYHLSFWLLIAGILCSLAKGLYWEEAVLLALILGTLWAGRAAFQRPASLLHASRG